MVDLLQRGMSLSVEAVVEPRFVDAMGHMNVAWYAYLFDKAVWACFAEHGIDDAYFARERRGMFALEHTTRYHAELREGDALTIHTGVLEVREKTLRLAHRMANAQSHALAATNEVIAAHIDLSTRRTTPFPALLAERLRAAAALELQTDGAMSEAGAQAFARAWIDAWNRLDIEAVLAHYAEDAQFVSPKAERFTGHGTIQGKAALRAYWQAGLARLGHVAFTLERAVWSPRAETLTLLYRAALGDQAPVHAAEVMRFRASRIVRGEALYGAKAATELV